MEKKTVYRTISEIFEDVADVLEKGSLSRRIKVGLTVLGSEHGPQELINGAEMAQGKNQDLEVIIIGSGGKTNLKRVEADTEKEAHAIMDEMLQKGELEAAATMHYSFPIGVATVGRVITPGKGREMYLATTTGTSGTERTIAMLKNALAGIGAAKACGNDNPTVGILNIEGARQVERALKELAGQGYPIHFTESARADGGVVMRGNDLLAGVPDVMIMDSLTGNVLMKVFSAFSSGGNYETLGYGYGPGLGENYDRIICILSRASGAPVVAEALRYAADLAKGKILEKVQAEYAAARKAGWNELLSSLELPAAMPQQGGEEITPPPAKPVTAEIPGIEILELEDAVQLLWKNQIYAESGMGCTGPIVMVAPEDKQISLEILKENKYL